MSVVAKVYLWKKNQSDSPNVETVLEFSAPVAEENEKWAKYTPSLNLRMQVNGSAADFFEEGEHYLLTFEKFPEE